MTHPVLTDVLADARNPGPVTGPRDLLSALAAIDRPMELLSNWDRCQALCSAFGDEYRFIQLARAAQVRPSDVDMNKWSALLRWMLEELTNWNTVSDPQQRTLATVFIAGTMSDIDRELWRLLPSPFGANRHLVETLQAMLKSCNVSIEAPRHTRTPISTKEFINRFATANAAKDWNELNECLDSFGDYISASLLQVQATRILARCRKDDLLSVLSGIDEALLAASFVDAIWDENTYLALAVDCTSPHFEFAALRGAMHQLGNPPRTAQALDLLLIKMSADPGRWRDLMHIFNRYSFWYPRLQDALGRALASVPLQASEAYIAAIQLNDVAFDDAGRENVAACLRAFHTQANRNQREAMWQLAYDRWAAWDFGRSDPNARLSQVRASLLDYAIVGYAVECLTVNAAMQARVDIITKSLSLHQNWYFSETAMITDWNRFLSSFQPFGHAEHILAGNNEDWLCKARNYLPIDTQTDYLKLKYRMS